MVFCILLIVIYMYAVADQLHRLGKGELICLLSFTCNYVVSVRRGFLFLWAHGMGCVILLWHFLSLPLNYFDSYQCFSKNACVYLLYTNWVSNDRYPQCMLLCRTDGNLGQPIICQLLMFLS